jgi:hypothetical protein
MWPMAFKDLLAKRVYFTLKYDIHPCSFKAKIKAANASEEGGDTHIKTRYRV